VESLCSFFLGDLFAVEILHHKVVGGTCDCLIESFLIIGCDILKIVGHGDLASLALCVIVERLHFNKVDHSYLVAVLNGNEYGAEGVAEVIVKLVEYLLEVRVVILAFVDEECLGKTCSGSIVPSKLGSDFNTRLCVNTDECAVSNAERLVYFAYEVEVTGGIENVDLHILPSDRSKRCGNGEASLYLFGIIVTYGVTVSSLTETVGSAGEIEHSLSDGGLTAAAMSEQSYVS